MQIGQTVECIDPVMGLSTEKAYIVKELIDNIVRVETLDGQDTGWYMQTRFK